MASKITEKFVDGAENIHFLGGLVRVDFATLQPNSVDPEKPTSEVTERLIMTPEGFLKTYSIIQRLAEHLLKQGVLKRVDAPASTKLDK